MNEERLKTLLAISDKVSRELININRFDKIPGFISTQLSKAFSENLWYAFVDRESKKIYESRVVDREVKNILPFLLQEKFLDEINKLEWTVIDHRGFQFILEKILNERVDLKSSFLVIPKKKGKAVTHLSVIWGSKILEQIEREEIDFICTICSMAEMRIMYLLYMENMAVSSERELKRKTLELKELTGIGEDLTSLNKEDFLGSFLLNVMGRTLSRSSVILLSTNENNTQYAVVACRGLDKKRIQNIVLSSKSNIVKELIKNKNPILVENILENITDEEKELLGKLEAEVLWPLISKDALIGILVLSSRINKQPFNEDVFESIKLLANQMVMAVENTKLHNLRHAFTRYISHQLASEILSNLDQIKLGGEKRNVAVLFADIRDFTSMAEKMSPEEVVNLLNTYLTEMTEIVFKYEGTLDKYIGDCVMAVFGAPVSHYNDTERAVVAAIEMQKFIAKLNAKREAEGLPAVGIGIGINCGEAIAGNMGSVDRMDYTVIGDTVNTAARLEEIAKAGQILVTRNVYDEVRYLVDANIVGTIRVKGKEKPIEVYEVVDLIAARYIDAVERAFPYISGHFLNIARDAELVGKVLGFSKDELIKFRSAALLIDVGRIGLDEKIFNKKGEITPEEFEIIKSHVIRGAEYVEKKLHLFKEGVDLIKHHHENWDGSGYPDGLKGEEIPLWARIIRVIDSYHALVSDRPFREAFREEEAMRILEEGKGKYFDPKIVDVYIEILKERKKEKERVMG